MVDSTSDAGGETFVVVGEVLSNGGKNERSSESTAASLCEEDGVLKYQSRSISLYGAVKLTTGLGLRLA